MDGRRKELRDGRDEMNLCEFPIAALSDRAPKGVNVLEYSREETDPKTGVTVTRQMTVAGCSKHGLPTKLDEEVSLALVQLTKIKNGFKSPIVRFTQKELLVDILGWGTQRSDYKRLLKSFCRLQGVNFYFDNSWRNNKEKVYESKGGFGLLASFELRDGRKRNNTASEQLSLLGKGNDQVFSEFEWNPKFFRSFQDGYLKKLDYELVSSLKHTQSKRLYRYLDKHFFPPKKLLLSYKLTSVAWEVVGITRTYTDKANILKRLHPAVEELEKIGFIEKLPKNERYKKLGGQWHVEFTYKEKPKAKKETSTLNSEASPLEKKLLDRGIENASKLVANYPAEEIEAAIENFDHRTSKGEDIGHGWLGAAIVQGGYGFRKDYKSQEQIEFEKKKKKLEQSEKVKSAAKARKRALKEQAEAREREEAVMRVLSGMTDQEVSGLEKEAYEASTEEARSFYESARKLGLGSTFESAKKMLIYEYLRSRGDILV